MMGDTFYWIGQFLGIVAVILGFVSFQMKTARGILIFQMITASVFSVHYFLIGALTAMGLNLLAVASCVFYYFRNQRGSNSMAEPMIFTALVILTSLLTWDGWYSVWIMVGLVINTISLSFSNAKKIRFAMLLKSPCCLLYNVFVLSGGGIVYECAVLLSSVIGIFKHREPKEIGEPSQRDGGGSQEAPTQSVDLDTERTEHGKI